MSLMDMISNASSISVGELHARSSGDADATAEALASLHRTGSIRFSGEPNNPFSLQKGNIAGQIKAVIENESTANRVFISPTATGLR